MTSNGSGPYHAGIEGITARLDEHAAELAELREFRVDLVGAAGNNGKMGALRGNLSIIRALLVAVATAALAGAGTGALALYRAGEERGREGAEIEHLRDLAEQNREDIRSLREEAWRSRLGLPPALGPAAPGATP